MPYGFYLSANGANAQMKRMEVIANNLANVDTVAFKPDVSVFQARYAEAIEQGLVPPNTQGINDVGGGLFIQQTLTNYAGGPLKHTQQPTDVAIEGDAFFMVEKDGERFLTRAGNFRIQSNGMLTTQQGYPVLDPTGQPLAIDPNGGQWEITTKGELLQNGDTRPIGLFQPPSLQGMLKVGQNLYQPSGEPTPLDLDQRRVAPGYLEMSGVEPTLAMTEMITTSRAVEANINLMRQQDEMVGGLIGRLLRV